MTYRSKCIGKRRRQHVVEDARWKRRQSNGLHEWCRREARIVDCGYTPSRPPARVRKRSGYKPSAERQVRVLVREWEQQLAAAMGRARRSLSMFLFGDDDE